MKPKKADKDWEAFAQMSPYYAVSIHDKFKDERLDDNARSEFFESGESHIELVLDFITSHLDSSFNPKRCLDFGCGVGRLVVPLARKFPHVLGVDVSKTMLNEARLNCQRYSLENADLAESDDDLTKVTGKFDFIHSFIVFQHIACRRGERLLKRMIDLLNDDGVAALHFTYAVDRTLTQKLKYWLHTSVPLAHNLINLIKGREFNHPYVLINRYDLNRLFRTIQDGGCEHSYVRFSNHDGLLGVIVLFQKKSVGILW